jgi:hypothetical protein
MNQDLECALFLVRLLCTHQFQLSVLYFEKNSFEKLPKELELRLNHASKRFVQRKKIKLKKAD